MKWLMLLLAGIFEIVWAVAMKYSNGFSILVPSVITAITYILSAVFLALALKYLPLGMAYVMWVAFGIIGTTILGVLLFSEKLTVVQIVSIILIIIGVIGLKFFAKQ
jgi:quaternary ammonium compound-resistance protein SugE